MDLEELTVMGLPLHPLIVHAVVVLLPLAALALVVGTLWPAARRRLGIVTPGLALVVLVLTPITILSGEALMADVGPVPSVLAHERLAQMLPPWVIALAVVAALQWAWFRWRPEPEGERRRASHRAVTLALAAAAIVVAVGGTTLVILIGEAGARSVWG
ncbi:DUF2231 domain-containing protein [Microbacterium karelineae]|uniref:DUF2231 domain-containing protein n=1 Tax=Microbacterium karelineae TaxID=2654283 RepID=UPI0012EA6BA6|nr:DUF2231 domain-containing protein [Microbacterium karelineae]